MTKHEIGKLKLNFGLRVYNLRSRMKFKHKINSLIKSAFFLEIIHVEKVLEQISCRIGVDYQNCHNFVYLVLCTNCNRYLPSNDMVVTYVILERMKKETAVTCLNIKNP